MQWSRRKPPELLRLTLAGLILLILSAATDVDQTGEIVRCPAVRDVWLSAMDGETDFNMGGSRTLKLKLWQEFALVDFDVSRILGHAVHKATLYIKPEGGHRLGLNGGSDLRWLTVSTVTHDWAEGRSRDYGTDRRGLGATFNESSYRTATWGWKGARAWDVILGNGNSMRYDGALEPAGNGWLQMEVDPRLVESLVAGTSHGLALMDGSTAVFVNSLIGSRESEQGPYLEVEIGPADATPPAPPASIRIEPHPSMATETTGACWISMQVSPETFAIDLQIDDMPLDRWQIPHPMHPEGLLSFPIVDLQPDAQLRFDVAAIDAAGNRSAWSEIDCRSSPAAIVPRLSISSSKPRHEKPQSAEPPRIWALPAVSKLDPVSHRLIDEPTPRDLAFHNTVWNGEEGTVSLIAARGELVSFQLVIQETANHCEMEMSDLLGPATLPRQESRLWRNWQVDGMPELAVPITGQFDLPFSDNALPSQQSQSFTIDFHIPPDSPPGNYSGTLTLRCRSRKPGKVDLDIQVFDAVIPDQVHFNIELNTYRGPGTAGSRRFVASQRLAHYHRATINRVPYSQKGRVHEDWIPRVAKDGRVISWDQFDRNLGGMLDGSWFVENPRGETPVTVLYLPLFEGWPTDFRSVYDPGILVPENAADSLARLKHDVLARPIEDSLPDRYGRAFMTLLQDFAQHAADKNWNRTVFQVYLNNKPKYGYSLWSFDEPFQLLDWRALNYFAQLTRDALGGQTPETPGAQAEILGAGGPSSAPSIVFRADVSRPMWQGSVADGLVEALYLSDQAYEVPRLIRQLKDRMPATLYNYGHTNAIEESNWRSVAWCLDAYLHEFDGVLPWQSVHGAGAMTQQVQTALIVEGGDYGPAIASLRVHALREGAQLVELMRLLQESRNWSRAQMASLVHQLIPSDPEIGRKGPPKTPMASATELSSQDFFDLKLGLLRMLEQGTAPRPSP